METEELIDICQLLAKRVQAWFCSEENQKKYEEWLKRSGYEKN